MISSLTLGYIQEGGYKTSGRILFAKEDPNRISQVYGTCQQCGLRNKVNGSRGLNTSGNTYKAAGTDTTGVGSSSVFDDCTLTLVILF
jgi:hypothetical protein